MDEEQTILSRSVSSDSGDVGRDRASNGSTARALKISGLTMLACMLVAGQALTIYYVASQHSQIRDLENTASNLKLQASRRPSGPSSPQVVRMPLYNMPMLMDMRNVDNNKIPATKLENTAKLSMEGQVKELLQGMELPKFNETFLANLKSLKNQMQESDWKGFENWMHQWLLFQMAQEEPSVATTEATKEAATIRTKCQLEATGESVKPGFYRPQCDEEGNYLPMQCWHSTGYCWCVDKNGNPIPGTEIRGRPMCGGPAEARMIAMPRMASLMEDKA
ncbi:CD74 molecule, major histocompatibility complex, class II invariant chain a [Brienomyrus brachyistius]|uniref:CD74 molecule, major histocompatibility complex, class II invariant chain a n=1 Tax=Brienomyrus brachyistius TaxID=42636 RepID=UPI0020B26E36|nr:CD74 molecule, major histocompatibility complex, class II invariant chain a [Brienomyrus brachyistius]